MCCGPWYPACWRKADGGIKRRGKEIVISSTLVVLAMRMGVNGMQMKGASADKPGAG